MASGSNAPFSGDHNDLENVNSGQHHQVVESDGTTIVENSNGKLENRRTETVIGDFENSFGSWNKTGDKSNVSLSTSETARGSQAVKIDATSNNAGIKRTINLTGFTEFTGFVHTDGSRNGGQIDVLVNGVVEASIRNPGNFVKFNVDISGISSSVPLELVMNAGEFQGIYHVDDIRIIKPERVIKTAVNGAGN